VPPQPSLLRYNRPAAFVCKTFMFARRSPATKVFHRISFEFITLFNLIICSCVHKGFVCNFRKAELRENIYSVHKIYSFLPTSAIVVQAVWKYYGRISGRGLSDHSQSAFNTGVNFNLLIRTLFLLWSSVSCTGYFHVETRNKGIPGEKFVLLLILKDACYIGFLLFPDTLAYCHCRSLSLQILLEKTFRNIEEIIPPTNFRAPQFGLYPWFAAFYFVPVIPSRAFIRSIRI